MKLTIDPFHLNATTGLAPSAFAGCARMKAACSLNSSGHLSRAARSVEAEKPHKPDDGNLAEAIRLAQQGDAAAFEFIYRLHCRRVYSLCLRMVKDPSQAEDLTQEAFMQVFRKLKTFRGDSAFSTWLHRLTFNIVLMRLRKKSPLTVSIGGTGDQDDEAESPAIDASAPDLMLEGSIDRLRLEGELSRKEQLCSMQRSKINTIQPSSRKMEVTTGRYKGLFLSCSSLARC
jgi:RNA polymerase sigma factor (sigma-70 family)